MPTVKTKIQRRRRSARDNSTNVPAGGCVLTLSEAAAYLRVPQSAILELVNEQGLPGRQIGPEWRFLRSALDDWLRTPLNKSSKEALLAMAGTWKNDPHLDEIVASIYEQRGRPSLESE